MTRLKILRTKRKKNAGDIREISFLKKNREDLINRISNLSSLRLKKIGRIEEINAELRKLY